MRRTLAAVLLSLSCATPCFAVTIHATTTDGKKVDLLDDGTWRWAEAPPAATSTGDHRRACPRRRSFTARRLRPLVRREEVAPETKKRRTSSTCA